MRVSKAQAEENRRRVVTRAAELFRERGIDGIGVAELMREAGLTHGGFYGQFESKEALTAEAVAETMRHSHDRWRATMQGAEAPIAALLQRYLTSSHRDMPGKGCMLPALAADSARRGGPLREAFTEGVRGYLALLEEAATGETPQARRQRALGTLSAMVGALLLSRAVEDPDLSDDLLEATRAMVSPGE
ncbi:TetR/AcrR family transcriptional regulator [Rhodovarius crocodyli]|uniref:TetR/AcrR family transcriptional regulator n=1 Tax=Rhodovarius crocodyli TaxID=1979269 RepID=A0A437MH54_9PROT|nr:TetR/AcrR family transcriptional regulator [Rhodovarius crocodyli]RVT96961.1 TetR/AcrR family transcriptional regulator [Rhodovarius crocodyli]